MIEIKIFYKLTIKKKQFIFRLGVFISVIINILVEQQILLI